MTKQRYPFEEISNWLTPPTNIQSPLAGNIKADVAIIGGGLTGLSTALSLKKHGVDVVIVEKSFCGSGSSGRNAGHLTPTIGKDIPTILKMFGREKARELIQFSDDAIKTTMSMIEEYEIDCDFVPNGNIIAAVHQSQEANLVKVTEIASDLGAHVEYLNNNAMRGKGIPSSFTAGIWETLGGVLQPGKLILGLRAAALDAGIRIFENTPMIKVVEGTKPVVHCEKGSISADSVVQCTNAYTNTTGRMQRMVLPLRVTQFETEPLNDNQIEALGWPNQEGIYTAHEMLENFRLTKRGTLVGGSRIVRSKFGGGLAEGYHEPTFIGLDDIFRQRFPELGHIEIAKWWGGWVGLTTNFLPKIGASKKHENIYHAIGFNGHGIAHASLAGRMISDRITGRENRYRNLFAKRGFAWPIEPFTWLGEKALSGFFSLMDSRVDARIGRD